MIREIKTIKLNELDSKKQELEKNIMNKIKLK